MIVGKTIKITLKDHPKFGEEGRVLAVTFKDKTMILFVQIGKSIIDVEHKNVEIEESR